MSNHRRKERKNYKQAVHIETSNNKHKCLCIQCFNMHCLLQGINTYRILKKLSSFAPATVYLECERNEETNHEIDEVKQISYYVFEKKEECYVKDEKEVNYSRISKSSKERNLFLKLCVEQ